MDNTVASVFSKIFASYNLLLIIASLTFNPMVLYVCLKSKKLRTTSTFKLLAFSSINDLLAGLAWNLECFSDTFFDLQIYYKSLFYCRVISVFLEFTTLDFTSWMLVSISLDRLLSISFKEWSKKYFDGVRPFIYSLGLLFLIAAINFNEVFLAGYSYTVNGTEIIICFSNPPDQYPWYNTMSKILVYFGFIVPYGLLIVFNSLIILKATKFERVQSGGAITNVSRAAARKKTEMTRTIIFITFLYIALSLPATIKTGYVYHQIFTLDMSLANMLINLINGIQFTYSAFNFFILYFSNKLFAEEVKLIFFTERKVRSINGGPSTLKTNS